jgi:hypothetical protein
MLWSFVGIALIGVTIIAYKDPVVYRKLTLGLVPILLCLLFAFVGWNWGQSSAYQSLAPHLSPDRAKLLMAGFLDAIEEKCVYDAAMLAIIGYLFFLGYLPGMRSKDASSAEEDENIRRGQSVPT